MKSYSKILIVDGETKVHDTLNKHLHKSNLQIFSLYEGKEVLKIVDKLNPDIILLDAVLPDTDGLVLCQEIRKSTDVPILFISERSEEADKIMGLSAGGDDYISKPFGVGELIARVKAHLRRSNVHLLLKRSHLSESYQEHVIRFGELCIDLQRCVVSVADVPVNLSSKEYKLLTMLAKSPGRVFQTEELYESIWGADGLDDHRTVPVHISTLRKKIERNPSQPQYICTVRGLGYKLEVEKQSKIMNKMPLQVTEKVAEKVLER